jgi:hypothetical protein
MSGDWICPEYPVYSYHVTPTGTVTLDNGTPTVIALSTLAGRGFVPNGSLVAQSGSLQHAFASAVATSGGGTCTCTYALPGASAMSASYVRAGGSASVDVTFSSAAAAAQFGFASASFTIGTTGTQAATLNPAGVWRPACFGSAYNARDVRPAVGFSERAGTVAPSTWSWGSTKWEAAIVHPDVRGANVEIELASRASYAAAAGRVTGDRNGTLQGLAEWARGARTNTAIRMYRSATAYADVYMKPPKRTEDLYTDAGAGQIYSVAFTLPISAP